MRDKKAQVEISFNWIFILLAGGAILMFFIFVVFKETSSSEEQINLKLSKSIDTLFSAIEQNPSSVKDVGYFNTIMNFDCQDESQHEFFIEGQSSRTLLDTQLFFSPRVIGDSNIVAWTLNFEAPYPVASMLLLSDDKVFYVFDTLVHQDLYNRFPDKFSKSVKSKVDINGLTDEGFRKYVIITDDANQINLHASLKAKGKTSIVQVPSGFQISEGEITFYEYESIAVNARPQEIGSASFVSTEMLYAAIVSGDYDLYKCGVDKLLKRTRFADDVNFFRMDSLYTKYSGIPTSICSIFYDSARDSITSKRDTLNTFHTSAGRNDFVSFREELVLTNQEMLSSSCPLMY